MAPFHHILAHFPVALLGVGFILMLYRALVASDRSRRLEESALLPCLILGIAGGLGALLSGLSIWPVEGMLASTMGRNKIIMASWMLAIWSLIVLLRWRGGEAVWSGVSRYVMLVLAGIGALLLTTTGTLGGHLIGSPSRFSGLLKQFGWSVYETYLAPDWVLIVMVAVGLASIVAGIGATHQHRR